VTFEIFLIKYYVHLITDNSVADICNCLKIYLVDLQIYLNIYVFADICIKRLNLETVCHLVRHYNCKIERNNCDCTHKP